PGAFGAGDGGGARLPARHSEIADLAGAGPPARRAGRCRAVAVAWPRHGHDRWRARMSTDLGLERALANLGAHLDYPPTPPLAEAVLARISGTEADADAEARLERAPRGARGARGAAGAWPRGRWSR